MNLLAEQSVIGALLMDINSIQKIYEELKPEMFQNEVLSRAYFEIVKAYDIGEPVNLVYLCHVMEGCGYSNNTVFNSLRECVANTVTSATIKTSSDVLISEHKARTLARIIKALQYTPSEIDSTIGSLMNELEALVRGDNRRLKPLSQIVDENQNKYFVDRPETGVKMGFFKLDDMLGNLEGGDVTVVGARPAVGKSAFVTQVIGNMTRAGNKVAFYNLEMMDKQVYERLLSNQTGIGLKRIKRAKDFLGDEKPKFDKANDDLKQMNVWISSGSVKVSEIRNECRHSDFNIIVIDYLQLIKSDVWYTNRVSEVGAISKAMKALAMELNIPIVVLSQLNRTSEGRDTKEPTMAELRESGDIEQDASNILLMWNTSKDDDSQKAIKIEKQRQGETGKVPLIFNGSIMRFEEADGAIPGNSFENTNDPTPFD